MLKTPEWLGSCPSVGSPALSSAQRRPGPVQPWPLPNSSSRARTAHCAEAEPQVPLPVTTEGWPPMPAGNHPSVPRERDQNRSLLGPTHKWGPAGRLLKWKWVGRPPGLTLGPRLGWGSSSLRDERQAPALGERTFPCAKSIFVGHVEKKRDSKTERQLQRPSEWPRQRQAPARKG